MADGLSCGCDSRIGIGGDGFGLFAWIHAVLRFDGVLCRKDKRIHLEDISHVDKGGAVSGEREERFVETRDEEGI